MSPEKFEVLLALAFPEAPLIPRAGALGAWSLGGTLAAKDTVVRLGGDWAIVENAAASNAARGIRAEVPLLADTAAMRAWVARQLRTAVDQVLATSALAFPAPREAGQLAQQADAEDLVAQLAASGWEISSKPDGTLRIHVQVRGTPRPVVVRRAGHVLHLSIALDNAGVAHASEPCRHAARVLLAHANASLRWTRAFLRGDADAAHEAGIECRVAIPAPEAALLAAVDALAAACDAFADEAELLLEHAGLASQYLQSQGVVHAAPDCEDEFDPDPNGAKASLPAPSHPAAQPAFA